MLLGFWGDPLITCTEIRSSAVGQGRIIKRVEIPFRKVGQPPGSESLEALW